MFEVFILAAGLGTRLKDLTKDKPKALVEIGGKTLLEHNINKLISFGCKRIIINVHHFADKIIEHIDSKNYDADIIISDERALLLDTGGAILNARNLFSKDKDILVHNVDIISKINFLELYNYHKTNKSLATLAVAKRETSRYLLFCRENMLCGWENIKTKERIIVDNSYDINELYPYAFSGIHFIKPQIIDLFDKKEKVFPIIPQYLNIVSKNRGLNQRNSFKAYLHSEEIWVDCGRETSFAKAISLLHP
ncbi:MAG: NTP transferase domain-containing protein [Bacteroidales bacterium]|jgi:NDP-sugar pyrophosphorylase family protein|nr:NTP transferase domain-containing protein [Bacteroidales bacterium]